MLVALKDEMKVPAWEAEKGQHFLCPQCTKEVVLKKGRIVIPHYAHKPPTDCSWATGETRAHMEAKQLVYDWLISRGLTTEVEHRLVGVPGERRADVITWSKNGKDVAVFELQHSAIDLDTLEARAKFYASGGHCQIWIPFLPHRIFESAEKTSSGYLISRYPAPQYQKWIHGFNMGNGMWFYHPESKKMFLGKLDKHQIYVESSSWYGEGGEEKSAGGYWKISKKYRDLILSRAYDLSELDIQIKRRNQLTLAHYNWPSGRIILLNPKPT